MPEPKLAAQLYTVREFTQTTSDFASSIRKIHDIGYTAAQVSAIGPIPPETVWQIVQDHDVRICNTHIAYERLTNDLDSVIAQHQLWQCRHVAIGSMPGEFRQEGEAGFKRFAEIANGIGEKLHAAGLSFSYHNHSFEFMKFGGRTGLDILYSETDPQFVQAEIDTFWIQHGGGDPVHWIRAMKNRMPVIHLKDMVMIEDQDSHARMGVRQMEAEIGQGNLNWPPILKACQEAGVEWYAIEQDFSLRDPFESLALSYRYLNELGYA